MWLQCLIPKSNVHGGVVETSIPRKRDEKAGRKGQNPEQQEDKEERKLEVIDHVLMNEKRIHSRVNILQSQKKSFLKVLQLGYQMVGLHQAAEGTKARIEKRGAIAKNVNLDVKELKP